MQAIQNMNQDSFERVLLYLRTYFLKTCTTMHYITTSLGWLQHFGSYILQLIFLIPLSWLGETQFPFAADPSHPFIVDWPLIFPHLFSTLPIWRKLVELFQNCNKLAGGVIEETASRRLLGVISGMFTWKPGITILANVCFNWQITWDSIRLTVSTAKSHLDSHSTHTGF